MGEKRTLSRKDFLRVAGVTAGALFFGELSDLMFFRGVVTSHLLRAKNDADYRQRLIDTIKQGRMDDKLRMEFVERTRPYSEICGLGDPLNYSEPVLESGFREGYQVRNFITGGEETGNLMLVANIGSNAHIYKTEYEEQGNERHNSLARTMKVNGDCITIPSSYVTVRENGYTLDSYCSYMRDGKVETYGEDKIDYASGALIVFDMVGSGL